jgi:carotenoid cleavage dioxygenase
MQTMTSVASSPYLSGTFAPVSEELTALSLPVTGRLPDYLDGRYLRNGPNPLGTVDPATYHWFLGAGMVHGVRIADGKAAWYRNRWVRSADVARRLGEPVRPGPVHNGMDFAANTHVIEQFGRTFAIVEGGSLPYELDDELNTLGPCDFDGTLDGGYTAHPLRDPATGELHAVSYFFGWDKFVRYTVIGVDGRVRRAVDIPVTGSPMMHAFSLTENHVVVYDLPVTFDLQKVMLAGEGKGPLFPYSWNPDYPARVGVLPREGSASDVRWFDVGPCYVYHPANAYDTGSGIVLDVVRHPKMFATHHDGPNEGGTSLNRWTLDLETGSLCEEQLDDRTVEFPRVDERLTGREHRFAYSAGLDPVTQDSESLLKYDLRTGTSVARDFAGPPDEFVFVPSAADADEDEGVLMGFVFDPDRGATDLMVLDAGTLETVAAVHLPARVPHGFHGSWNPS